MNRSLAAAILSCSVGMTLQFVAHGEGSFTLVLTQIPKAASTNFAAPADFELAYPPGSRIVASELPYDHAKIRILSEGLSSAGNPVVASDGKSVYFMGQAQPHSPWQIYRSRANAGKCAAVTSVAAGAMDPSILPDGEIIYVSPTKTDGHSRGWSSKPQIYAQAIGEKPHQLTFSPGGATSPIVLTDGRILFVSGSAQDTADSEHRRSLFTINNDGTELTAFAGQHGRAALMGRPREMLDGRIALVVSGSLSSGPAIGSVEYVESARPFAARTPLFPAQGPLVSSVQPLQDGRLLVCAAHPVATAGMSTGWSVFVLTLPVQTLGSPLVTDSSWDTVEGVELAASRRPLGHISNMEPTKRTGQILCLNVNYSTYRPADSQSTPDTARIRVTMATTNGLVRALGEVKVQPDGSFMAEVPADVPLGFEALNDQGQVVRRVDPVLWIRPGENRSCVGCHAPHNRSPHNRRPMAVRGQVPRLCDPTEVQTAVSPSGS